MRVVQDDDDIDDGTPNTQLSASANIIRCGAFAKPVRVVARGNTIGVANVGASSMRSRHAQHAALCVANNREGK